jgi:serine/threonine protein phosphatase PrpC
MIKVVVAHVGDSRLYRLRGEEFVAMTHDHSVLQEQIDSGLISPPKKRVTRCNRNLVTRAVGVEAMLKRRFMFTRCVRAMFICYVPMACTTWSKRRKSSTLEMSGQS